MKLSFFKAFWAIPGTLFCTIVLVIVSSYCFMFLLFFLLFCCFNVLVPNKSINQKKSGEVVSSKTQLIDINNFHSW